MSLLIIFMSSFYIFTAYRGAMNAFLAVRISRLPIRNINDILNKNYPFVMWKQGFLEGYMKALPQTNLQRLAYDKSQDTIDHQIYMKVSIVKSRIAV